MLLLACNFHVPNIIFIWGWLLWSLISPAEVFFTASSLPESCLVQLFCIDKLMLLVFIPNVTSSSLCPSSASGPHWWPTAQVQEWVFWGFFLPQGSVRIALSQFHLCCISPPYIFSFCPRSNHSVILTFIAKHKSVTPNLDIYSHAQINSSKSWCLLPSTNQQFKFLEATKNYFKMFVFPHCTCHLQMLRGPDVGQRCIFQPP